jgi:type IV fimbrial biogenesis protein FimT
MIVIVIAGIMMSVAVPRFEEGMKRNRKLSALEMITGMVSSARSEAVARATSISLCSSEDTVTCGGNWEDGALMFEDTDRDGVLDSGEETLRVFGAAGSGITIRRRVAGAVVTTAMTFDQFGGLDGAGTLVVCNADGIAKASGIVLNASGQARLATDDTDSGVINLENEADLGACP